MPFTKFANFLTSRIRIAVVLNHYTRLSAHVLCASTYLVE
jgi:hypothetical protein